MFKKSTVIPPLIVLCIGAVACSNTPNQHKETFKKDSIVTAQSVGRSGGAFYTVLNFNKGKSNLEDSERVKVRQLISRASSEGQIDELKVLAWSDNEYPAEEKKVKVPKRDVTLANDRVEVIEDYLEDDLKVQGSVDGLNMTKRPNAVSKLFSTDEYEIKSIFENSGASPTVFSSDFRKILNGKSSKAVIFVKYKI